MTLEEQLADAKTQYHLLVTGQQAKVYVDQNGERVEFTSANRGSLRSYIQELERQIGSTRPAPMRVLI